MVKDVAEEAKQDSALVLTAHDDPATVDLEEQAVAEQLCEHCGHYPCGCGG